MEVQKLLENFPTEMLIEIFRYLSDTDITDSVIFVCKRWLSAAKNLRCMTIRSLNFITRPPPKNSLEFIRTSDFQILSINLCDPIFELFPVDLWSELGKTVKTIRFNRCTDMNEQHLITILKNFPCLECLNFRFRFPELSFNFNTINGEPQALKNLSNIRELNLNSNIWMDMSKVEQLVSRMDALEHFGLWCLGITPYNDIMKVVKKRKYSLKSLSLRHCRTNNGLSLLEKLTNLEGLELERFTFSISWIDPSDVKKFLEKQKNLKVLQLGTSFAFPNEYFTYLQNLKDLQELSIDISEYHHTHHILKRFFELTSLQNLSLQRSVIFDIERCIGLHEKIVIRKLRHLHLDSFNVECQLCHSNFFESLQNLRSLSLPNSEITNNELALIFEHLTRLRSLDLSRCIKITDDGMIGMHQSSSEKRLKTANFGLKSLKGLTYLNLSGCKGLTDITFTETYEMLDLKTLNVSCVPGLTATGIENLAKNFRSLESLQIYGNKNVDAKVLEIILTNLHRLKELDISKFSKEDGCEPLTHLDIEAICKFSQKLKTLMVLQRKLLTSHTFHMFQNIPTLMSVNDSTKSKWRWGLDVEGKKFKDIPGNEDIIDESFLRVYEAVRDKNTDFIKEPISLRGFLM